MWTRASSCAQLQNLNTRAQYDNVRCFDFSLSLLVAANKLVVTVGWSLLAVNAAASTVTIKWAHDAIISTMINTTPSRCKKLPIQDTIGFIPQPQLEVLKKTVESYTMYTCMEHGLLGISIQWAISLTIITVRVKEHNQYCLPTLSLVRTVNHMLQFLLITLYIDLSSPKHLFGEAKSVKV